MGNYDFQAIEAKWQPLWEDVRDLADGLLADGEVAEHFLGAVVLESAAVFVAGP